MFYAIIDDGVVAGLQQSSRPIVSDSVVSCDETIQIGYSYSDGVFTEPAALLSAIAPEPAILSPVSFITHMNDSTSLSLETLTELDTHTDNSVRAKWKLLLLALTIERDSPITISGFQTMVSAGIITQEQMDAAMDSWPTI